MAEISRVKEIQIHLATLAAKPEPLATDGARNSVGGHGGYDDRKYGDGRPSNGVTQFFMKTHRKPFDNYARLQKD